MMYRMRRSLFISLPFSPGIRHDDYDYREMTIMLDLPLRKFIKVLGEIFLFISDHVLVFTPVASIFDFHLYPGFLVRR